MALGLLMAVGGIYGRDLQAFLNTPAWNLQSFPARYIQIDWTGGYLFARAEAPLPVIVSDPYKTGGVHSLTEARMIAREKARELATARLFGALWQLNLDGEGSIGSRMERDGAFKSRMADLGDLFQVRSRRTGMGRVAIELGVPFFGARGLYALLADKHYNQSSVPELQFGNPATDPISSIIIDMEPFSDFQVSLEPRIYTAQGRLIFGPEMASRTCAIRYGLVGWHTSANRARLDRRAGEQPYFTFAGGLRGPRKSDIYLDDADVTRILGNREGRQALRRCNVLIVVDQRSAKK
ncbi:MAG: hypothetical protein KDK39_03360 [Leptospiraceae bacterium]|nr:hypothetical protein [Leptospiraceae bacterium]